MKTLVCLTLIRHGWRGVHVHRDLSSLQLSQPLPPSPFSFIFSVFVFCRCLLLDNKHLLPPQASSDDLYLGVFGDARRGVKQ